MKIEKMYLQFPFLILDVLIANFQCVEMIIATKWFKKITRQTESEYYIRKKNVNYSPILV